MQIEDATSEDELREYLAEEEAASLLFATAFRKPLMSLSIEDKPCVKSSLIDYHTMLKAKAEMDQFAEGLGSLGVLEMTKCYPDLFLPLFMNCSTPLTPGKCLHTDMYRYI